MARVKPYILTSDEGGRVIAALGQDQFTLAIPQWADFEVNYITGYLLYAGAAAPMATVRISDTGIQEDIQNQAANWWTLVGIAQDVFVLPQPLRFHRNSNLFVQVADATPAPGLTFRYWLTFTGTLIYPEGREALPGGI